MKRGDLCSREHKMPSSRRSIQRDFFINTMLSISLWSKRRPIKRDIRDSFKNLLQASAKEKVALTEA